MTQGKKIIRYIFIAFIGVLLFFTWRIFGPNTHFEEAKKSFFIKTGSGFSKVESDLEKNGIIENTRTFRRLAKLFNYNKNIIPGKYVIQRGASMYSILKTLKSGRQTPVNLVITKLRTKEDFAEKIAANFENDSAAVIGFLNSNDSLAAFSLDSNTVMTAVMPNTYSILWNTPFSKIFKRLYAEQQRFWNNERKEKSKALGLTTQQVYTLASIVEEETNKEEDKGKIASVYINRLNKGMRLGADPTVKFALKDFGLKRIYEKHLRVESPYNTYLNSGLPPGPICTPSLKTIDAVLDAPATSYLYFVAKPELNGYSNFASTYEEHLRFAKAYQQALDTLMLKKSGAIN
jgi:UPF0755 protein